MTTSPEQPDNLLLMDGIAPFFRGYKKKRVNWSKIPFDHIESGDALHPKRIQNIRADFAQVCGNASEQGFTGIMLDDVAHLAPWDGYPPPLREKILQYRDFYRHLFETAYAHDLSVYLTTDIMFFTPELKQALGQEGSIREADRGVAAVERMIARAAQAGIPDQGLALELDTLRILALARRYFFRPFNADLAMRLREEKKKYAAKHKNRYRIRMDFTPTRLRTYHLRLLHLLLFRRQRRYRVLDHVLALGLLPLFYPLIAFICRRALPKFARKQAMGAEVLFR